MSEYKVGDVVSRDDETYKVVATRDDGSHYWNRWGFAANESENYLIQYVDATGDEESIYFADEKDLTLVVVDTATDNVNHPGHYSGFSNDAEVIDISENLTSNSAQALQYIARSSRIDGNNKGDTLEDLRKAQWFLAREITRLEGNA